MIFINPGCNYFAFNQSYLAKGKIAPIVLSPHESK